MIRLNRSPLRKIKHQGGFTLIEVMISILILTIGILGVASMQTSAVRGNNTARSFSETSILAQNLIETIIRLPYDNTAADGFELRDQDGANDGTAGLNDGELSGNDADLTLSDIGPDGLAPGRYTVDINYAVSNLGGNLDGNDVKTIRVIATWQDGIIQRNAVFDFTKSRNLGAIK